MMCPNKKEILQKKINQIPSILRLFVRRGILSCGFIFETIYIISSTQRYERIFFDLTCLCFAIHLLVILFLNQTKLDVCLDEYEELYMKYPKKLTTEIIIIAICMILLILIRFIFKKVLV